MISGVGSLSSSLRIIFRAFKLEKESKITIVQRETKSEQRGTRTRQGQDKKKTYTASIEFTYTAPSQNKMR